MSTRSTQPKTGRIGAITSAVALVALVGGGVYAYAATPTPEKEPAAVVETVEPIDLMQIPLTNGIAAEQEAEAAAIVAEAARVEAERVAAEAAAAEAARIEAERVAAEQAAAEQAAREQAEREAANRNTQRTESGSGGGDSGGSQPAPIRCPGGSSPTESDGYNETACLPDECFSGDVGPDRPHCMTPFRP